MSTGHLRKRLDKKPENRLFYGDNLDVLRRKVKDETVDLCYIDPPFNSKRNYNQIYNNVGTEDRAQAQAFTDTWVWDDFAISGYNEIISNDNGRFQPQLVSFIQGMHAVLGKGSLLAYLVHMSLRITEIHRVLKPTGSFYLHCDPTSSHYLKLILDAVFVSQGGDFRNEIVWRRSGSHNSAKCYGPIHDVIFFYVKTAKHYLWNKIYQPYSRGYVSGYFNKSDKKGIYRSQTLTGSGVTINGESGRPWRGYDVSAKGRHWAFPGVLTEELGIDENEDMSLHEKLDFLFEGGYLSPTEVDGLPEYRQYLNQSKGTPLQDIWAYQPYTNRYLEGTEQAIDEDVKWLEKRSSKERTERMGYPTQKPEGLLERIIKTSSNEGDIVLDAYCGCGTTVAVAQRLNRKWIGIDITYQSISLVLKRLEEKFNKEVLDTIITDGIPRDMESAIALANKKDDRLRKEFEKWAVLTYTNNRAIINEKKGADGGIDGRSFFMNSKNTSEKVIYQAKSGKVNRTDISALRGEMDREGAVMSYFITLNEPTDPMFIAAKAAGKYHHEIMGRDYNRITIVTVKDIIERDERLKIPASLEVLKRAEREHGKRSSGFGGLFKS